MSKVMKTSIFIAGFIVFAIAIFSGTTSIANASGESLKILSPKAGAKWKVGETRSIKWKSKNIDKVSIYIITTKNIKGSGSTNYITPNGDKISASDGLYAWNILLNQLPEGDTMNKRNKFRIQIYGYDKNGNEIISKKSRVFVISK